MVALSLKQAGHCQQWLQQTWKYPVLLFAVWPLQRNKIHSHCLHLQSIKILLTLKLNQYSKNGSTFPKASRSLPAVTAADLEISCAFVCSLTSLSWSSALSSVPQAQTLILQSKLFNVFLTSLLLVLWLPDDQQGIYFGIKLELCSLTNEL